MKQAHLTRLKDMRDMDRNARVVFDGPLDQRFNRMIVNFDGFVGARSSSLSIEFDYDKTTGECYAPRVFFWTEE